MYKGRRQVYISFFYWIDGPSIYQNDQLEEVGRCGCMDSKKACTDWEDMVVTCRFPKIKGSIWFLRAEGKALGRTLPAFENTRERLPRFGCRPEICFNKDCSIIQTSQTRKYTACIFSVLWDGATDKERFTFVSNWKHFFFSLQLTSHTERESGPYI